MRSNSSCQSTLHSEASVPLRDLTVLRTTWDDPPVLQSRTSRTRAQDPSLPLKRISLELSRRCNLRCSYCYSSASMEREGGLTDLEVRMVMEEAVQSGACAISIVAGGEPMLRPSMVVGGESCIDYANRLGCYCYLYTNCTLIDRHAASWLFSRDVSVVGKLNSLREDVQDSLAGVGGASTRIRRGIDLLLESGFASSAVPRLGLETIICRGNYDEMPELWRWMRRRNIVPEVEIPTMHGRAADNCNELCFNEDEAPEKYRTLFEELLAIDRSEFGFDWVPHPPFAGGSCRLYYENCYINDQGGVQPCAGIDREFGQLRVGPRKSRGMALLDVVRETEFRKLRQIDEHVEGVCRDCELLHSCYGCRAAAWNKTGNIFAEDPICWRRR